MKLRKFQPNDTIMKANDSGDEFFIVQQGICAQFSPTGRHLEDLYEGDYFGEQALLKKSKRQSTVHVCLCFNN